MGMARESLPGLPNGVNTVKIVWYEPVFNPDFSQYPDSPGFDARLRRGPHGNHLEILSWVSGKDPGSEMVQGKKRQRDHRLERFSPSIPAHQSRNRHQGKCGHARENPGLVGSAQPEKLDRRHASLPLQNHGPKWEGLEKHLPVLGTLKVCEKEPPSGELYRPDT